MSDTTETNLYACKMYHAPLRQVCIKQNVNGYEISTAFDDSCNDKAKYMTRGDIRIYRISDDKDVSELYTMGQYSTIVACIENLTAVYNWCMQNPA